MDPIIIIPSLTSLEIAGAWLRHPLSVNFSSFTNLKSLTINCYSFSSKIDLPPSLTSLILNSSYVQLPPLLPNLIHFDFLNSSLVNCYPLPFTLKSLRHNFNHEIFNLPHLTSLQLDPSHSCSFSFNSLPPSLSQITFGNRFDHNIDNLPSSLTYIKLGLAFNQPISSLPPSLKRLIFGHSYDQPLPPLPSSLTHLKLDGRFNQLLYNLPKSLSHLLLGNAFEHNIDHLPEGSFFILLLLIHIFNSWFIRTTVFEVKLHKREILPSIPTTPLYQHFNHIRYISLLILIFFNN